MSLKFGTSGIRGLVTEMTPEAMTPFLDAFLALLKERGAIDGGVIAVGIDLRESSPAIENHIAKWLESRGGQVDSLGVVPTPALAYYCSVKKIPGIMVTGSHIPADRNGIKFYLPEREILKSEETAILDFCARGAKPVRVSVASGTEASVGCTCGTGACTGGGAGKRVGAGELYMKRYLAAFPAKFLEGKRIVVYEHSSAARDALTALVRELGGTAIPEKRSATFVAVDTENLSSLDVLGQLVREHHADALISTDGDGDRPLLLDERGELVRGDLLSCIGAELLVAKRVITPVTSSSMLELSKRFAQITRTKVGSPFVVDELLPGASVSAGGMAAGSGPVLGDREISIGFEANGGFILGSSVTLESGLVPLEPLLTRDSVLPLLLALFATVKYARPLSALRGMWPGRCNDSGLIAPVEREVSEKILASVEGALDGRDSGKAVSSAVLAPLKTLGFSVSGSDAVDGVRLLAANHEIVHLRPSGNAPEFRVYTESHEPERAHALLETALGGIRALVQELRAPRP